MTRSGNFGTTPGRQRTGVAGRLLVSALGGYKRWISPLLPRSCRFSPTCSEYARLAVLEHGALRGAARAAARIARCQPMSPGGIDLP